MSFLRALKTVFWLFLGVRSVDGRESDFNQSKGKNVFILFAAIFGAFILFVLLIYFAAKYAASM